MTGSPWAGRRGLALPASLKAQNPFPGLLAIPEPFLRISPSHPPSGALGEEGDRERCSEASVPRPGSGRFCRLVLPWGRGPSPRPLHRRPTGRVPSAPSPQPNCPQPHRPVGRAVGDGVSHAGHGQASPAQFGNLLLHEEIVGIAAGPTVGHGVVGPRRSPEAQPEAGALAGLPPLVTELGACARSCPALDQSGRSAQPHWLPVGGGAKNSLKLEDSTSWGGCGGGEEGGAKLRWGAWRLAGWHAWWLGIVTWKAWCFFCILLRNVPR